MDDLRAVTVAAKDGAPVRVGDLAEVRIGSLTRYGAVTQDGRAEAVQGLVLGLRGANAREVVANVRARLAELEPTLPKGVTTRVFYDRGAHWWIAPSVRWRKCLARGHRAGGGVVAASFWAMCAPRWWWR